MDSRVITAAAWMRQNWALSTIAAGGVVITAAIASMTSNYRPLLDQVQQRYLESEDRAAWQVTAREAAAEEQRKRDAAEAQRREEERLAQERAAQQAEERRRADARRQEEAAHQRAVAAEQERQRVAQETAAKEATRQQMVAQYQAADQAFGQFIGNNRWILDAVKTSLAGQMDSLRTVAGDSYALSGLGLTFDEVHSGAICQRGPVKLKGAPKLQQYEAAIMGCAMYRVLDATARPSGETKRKALIAAYVARIEGVDYSATNGRHAIRSVEDLAVYYWLYNMNGTAMGGAATSLPPLYASRGELNPALLGGSPNGLAQRRLFARMPDAERQHFVMDTYPRLTALQAHAGTLARLCRALAMPRCDNALTRYFADA